MKLDLDIVCPKCGGRILKPIEDGKMSCGSTDPISKKICNNVFKPENSPINKRVIVKKPLSVWDGWKGRIEEIIPNPKCPVKVKFVRNKQVFSDSFHPVHLEEV